MDKNIAAAIVNLQDAIENLENAKANIKAATFENCTRADRFVNINYRDGDLGSIDHLIYYANKAIDGLHLYK